MATGFPGGIKEGQLITVAGTEQVANGDEIQIYLPNELIVTGVAVRANELTNPGDGDVTVDVEDDGTSILSSAISVAAVDTTYSGTLSTNFGDKVKIDSGSILTVTFALSGTSPVLGQYAVVIY